MEHPNLDTLKHFDLSSIPTLDVVVLGALERFADDPLPAFPHVNFSRPLVVGSGNAASAGKILFRDSDAVFADESSYQRMLEAVPTIDGAVLISASGAKDAIGIADNLCARGLPVQLFTNNPDAPAKDCIGPESVTVFPKNREPYTYNMSTYLGMILSQTKENPRDIIEYIRTDIAPHVPENLASYDAFFFTLPPEHGLVGSMFLTKFDELFGARVSARAFTVEQVKHAKTLVPTETELFLNFGDAAARYTKNISESVTFHLARGLRYGTLMAVGYYIIGKIQEAHPPYFKNYLPEYIAHASEFFGQKIDPIVE